MGAHAIAYLILGVNLENIYNLINKETEYDLHDPKTGLKTGKKGYESDTYYMNFFTKEIYKTDKIYQLGISEDYIHKMDQDSEEYFIGVIVSSINDHNGGYNCIKPEKIEEAHKKFHEIVDPHLNGLKLEPQLILNLYWSY